MSTSELEPRQTRRLKRMGTGSVAGVTDRGAPVAGLEPVGTAGHSDGPAAALTARGLLARLPGQPLARGRPERPMALPHAFPCASRRTAQMAMCPISTGVILSLVRS